MLTAALLLSLSGPVGQTVDVPTTPSIVATPTLEEAVDHGNAMVEAFVAKDFVTGIGELAILLSILVGLFNLILLKLTNVEEATRKRILFFSLCIGGALVGAGKALIGGQGVVAAIIAGVITSGLAAVIWNELASKIIPKPADPAAK
jgi:hypothetical protein